MIFFTCPSIFSECLSTCGQLAYLPYKRRDLILDDENIELYAAVESNSEANDEYVKEEKKTRKHGLLNWLKLRVRGIWILEFCGIIIIIVFWLRFFFSV